MGQSIAEATMPVIADCINNLRTVFWKATDSRGFSDRRLPASTITTSNSRQCEVSLALHSVTKGLL